MTTSANITIVELCSQSDILANLITIESAVNHAARFGADLVVLPENAFCFGNQSLAAAQFEALRDWASQLARRCQVHLLAGTLPCPYRPDGTLVDAGKFRQSSLLFDPSGAQVARYDKIHLFKATVNDSTGGYDEGRTFEAGDRLIVAQTALGSIGLMICFDIRFAPLALRLRQMGADILTAPSAFTYQTGQAHWDTLLTARALDSQCLLVGAGQHGTHEFYQAGKRQVRETWGHSQIVDANGLCVSTVRQLDMGVSGDKLVLSKQATSWLAKDEHASIDDRIWQDNTRLTALLSQTRLVSASFDAKKQQQYRNDMPLSGSQRFDIQGPRPLAHEF